MSLKIKNFAIVLMASVFLAGFSAWSIFKPDDVKSVSERRALASLPQADLESVMSGKFMSSFDKYTLDQFPLRDSFRTLKAITAFYILGQKDNNGIFISSGHASKLEYPLDTQSISYAASRFQYVYDRYLSNSGSKIYLSVIPDKNFFLASQNGYPSIDYEKLIDGLRREMPFAKYIDITGNLELSDYYTTDTHWRQEKIIPVAGHLAKETGIALTADYTVRKVDAPFYGIYYGQSALPIAPDEMYYLYNDFFNQCRVYDYETDSVIPVYDNDEVFGDDPYEMFLSGPKSLLTIENHAVQSGRELIMFRDSFSSSLAPLLAEVYSKITLIDIRYMSPDLLGRFVTFSGQDVLFIYSTSVLNSSVTIK